MQVTGSQDRTLKIWDLQRGACTRTVFAGSSCSDVIATKRSVGWAELCVHAWCGRGYVCMRRWRAMYACTGWAELCMHRMGGAMCACVGGGLCMHA